MSPPPPKSPKATSAADSSRDELDGFFRLATRPPVEDDFLTTLLPTTFSQPTPDDHGNELLRSLPSIPVSTPDEQSVPVNSGQPVFTSVPQLRNDHYSQDWQSREPSVRFLDNPTLLSTSYPFSASVDRSSESSPASAVYTSRQSPRTGAETSRTDLNLPRKLDSTRPTSTPENQPHNTLEEAGTSDTLHNKEHTGRQDLHLEPATTYQPISTISGESGKTCVPEAQLTAPNIQAHGLEADEPSQRHENDELTASSLNTVTDNLVNSQAAVPDNSPVTDQSKVRSGTQDLANIDFSAVAFPMFTSSSAAVAPDSADHLARAGPEDLGSSVTLDPANASPSAGAPLKPTACSVAVDPANAGPSASSRPESTAGPVTFDPANARLSAHSHLQSIPSIVTDDPSGAIASSHTHLQSTENLVTDDTSATNLPAHSYLRSTVNLASSDQPETGASETIHPIFTAESFMDEDLDPGSSSDALLKSIARSAMAHSDIIGPSATLLPKSAASLVADDHLPASVSTVPHVTPMVRSAMDDDVEAASSKSPRYESTTNSDTDDATDMIPLTPAHPKSKFRIQGENGEVVVPCVRCFKMYARGKDPRCNGPATYLLSGKAACDECARKQKSCDAFPESVAKIVKEFCKEGTTSEYRWKKKLREIREAMLLAEPVKRKDAEVEVCKEVLMLARKASEAVQRARKVQAAVADVDSRGYYPVAE